ncbi:uncharacterized protein MONOS_12099 [Monocercomonoides exilis]|uniref:uncharacterized protein n=1 Tax=Monocercomonoides exilis TaxID=2049356 RepID=UPI003559F0F9|nr:hypothetical protein MONOS_12099 [Monocercomonoides exilis]|eukprot:MONOS_12099.1-p1 / transcript=MONOS_12099.1 / gene=MONOS_12099 / organism=Monocercomonoides_exilis_PA203 / gene_product=unspecified product / transcript_product=unspecified product / location=Mono_scaffold00645:26348-27763(-) / protein_length=472 / sequence_SO=supercontig / SO=protein_coding / is_pseudo=false
MNSCFFSSVCDVYDGGIVPSLNNPYASLSVSNTSFVGCCRARNVECIGTADRKLTPGRQNETFNGANSFIWCEWNGSKAAEMSEDYSKQASNGGAIFMYGLTSGSLTVSNCSFNDCLSYYGGGGIMCHTIKSVGIESSTFNCCVSTNRYGGGVYLYGISTCARVSGCEFKNCQAIDYGGGLKLDNFNISGTRCISTESGEGESACVFDCSFTSCSVSGSWGGGMYCYGVPNQFKMRSMQFISCSAMTRGGGFHLEPAKQTAPNETIYCYFLFFHECKCLANVPYGHDMIYLDYYKIFLNSDNPFYECYTTNTDDKRVCYAHYPSDSWVYDQISKKDWLKRGILNRFVAVSGGNAEELCGLDESSACRTIGVAVEKSVIQVSLSVTLMGGDHTSETTTIDIGTKKISVVGTGIEKSTIGTEVNSYSSPSSPSFTPLNCRFHFFILFVLLNNYYHLPLLPLLSGPRLFYESTS